MKHYKYKEYIQNVFPCMYYGILCGAVTGALIFLFKLAAKKAEEISRFLYAEAGKNPLYTALAFLVLGIAAMLMYFLHKSIVINGGQKL